MHFAKAALEGNSFLGVFAKTNDAATLLPKNSHERFRKTCSEVLKTRIVTASIANSDIIGMLSAMNSNGIILPSMVYDPELEELRNEGFNTAVIKDRRNALGSNLLVNDAACMVNPSMSKESLRKIADCLGVEVVQGTIGGYKTVGAMAVVTNRGILTRTNLSDEEFSSLEKLFKVKGAIGTANMGVPFVGLCMIANRNGFIAGELTSGYELSRVDEALGFIER